MKSLIELSLTLPGSVILESGSLSAEFDLLSEAACVVGIQHHRGHKRFVNFFHYGGGMTVYFKHDPMQISTLYESYPEQIVPSEVATKYWSKARVGKEVPSALLEDLIRTSHSLVLQAMPKKHQALVSENSSEPWDFKAFHSLARELERLPEASIRYMQVWPPGVLHGISPFVQFWFNNLLVFFPSDRVPVELSEFPVHEKWDRGQWLRIGPGSKSLWHKAALLSYEEFQGRE